MDQQYQYSQTCFFTRIPILPGNECCVFTVASTSICEMNCGRPESWYAPVPVPLLYGTYDGFGSVNLTDPEQTQEMQRWYKKQQKFSNDLPDFWKNSCMENWESWTGMGNTMHSFRFS